MDNQQLRVYLEQLSSAIDGLQAADGDKEKLQGLIDAIELRIAEPATASDEPQNIADQVDELVSTFEAEHPTVAGILNNIMMTLTSMGI